MNNVIKTLELLGQSANFQETDCETLAVINEAYLDEEVKAAMASGDMEALETLLHTKFKIFCVLFPAKDDEDESDDTEQDDDKKDESEENSKMRISA